uniref:O-acyltransferase WSD1 C-terminal domain-containing protein n=1 Tax=Anopheles culicifacies TaxID=139723 RepID=A0A182LWN0_9DIPT
MQFNQVVVQLINVVLLAVIILSLPVLLAILALFQVHRQIVAQLLAAKYGSSFRGLMEGSDVVWAGQQRSSKAMVNALLLFEKPARLSDDCGGYDFIEILRHRLKRHQADGSYQKMFWERRFQWGYYFWKEQELPLWADRYVKELDTVPNRSCLSRMELCTLIGSISSRDCNGTSWELLVGRQPLRRESGGSSEMLYPDFFDSVEKHVWNPDTANQPDTALSFLTWRNLCRMAFYSPRFLINEILFKRERNSFVGAEPSENKIVCWIGADSGQANCTTPVINVIKNVKRSLAGCSFTDVFLTAFASSLRTYWSRKGVPIPPCVTIAVMRRFERETKEIQLRNRSTAVLKTLPVAALDHCRPIDDCCNASKAELLSQINAVRSPDDATQAAANALLTHLIVSYLPELLPAPIVRLLFSRSQFTIGLSNIPAFGGNVSMENYTLRETTFWVPNVENNLFGLTLMSTDGRLQIGAIADRRIMGCVEELDGLLNDTLIFHVQLHPPVVIDANSTQQQNHVENQCESFWAH